MIAFTAASEDHIDIFLLDRASGEVMNMTDGNLDELVFYQLVWAPR